MLFTLPHYYLISHVWFELTINIFIGSHQIFNLFINQTKCLFDLYTFVSLVLFLRFKIFKKTI